MNAHEKAPKLETALNNLTQAVWGRTRTGLACVACGSNKMGLDDFKDKLSLTESKISHFCQVCQDDFFGEKDEEEMEDKK